MRSIRTQFLAFVFVLLAILIVLLNIFPLTASRDQVFEEKKTSLSAQASVISSSLGGLDTLSRESVSDVLTFLDISGFARMIVTDSSGIAVYDDGGQTGVIPEIQDLFTALGGKIIFRSVFQDSAFQSSVITPISSRQGLITGAVYLYEYDAERAGILLEIQGRIRNISLAIGLVALALVILFSELIIHRISELVASIRIVAAGNYDHRLTTHGRDEITELGEEFNLLTERLDTTEKQRRRFVSDASHELKTPLASIRLLSDSIVQNDGMDTETIREFASDIGNEAERLQRTTEKLLDLSRLDDDVQVAPEPVDVKQTIMDAVSSLSPVAAERRVTIDCDLEDGCVIMATADDLYHIVFNLIENAVKYNVPDGSVHVTADADDTSVTLTVEDTGIGIPEADRLNIFSRFYRVDKARSREAGGSGLGLSIVHDAVLAHGGSITVGANKPQGSVFIVTFPRPTSEETGI
jgi:signal transduction histidine kinase